MTPAREPLPNVEDWAARLELRNRSGEYVGPCPVCGGTDRFHVRRGRGGAAMVGCRGCIDGQPPKEKGEAFGRILRAVFPERCQSGIGEKRRANGNDFRAPSKGRYRRDCAPAPISKPPRKPPESRSEAFPGPDDADARRKVARRVWESTEPLPGTIAEGYLTARGVGHVSGAKALRFHPAPPHPHAPGRFPCLVAGVQDAHGGFLGIQRIYLDREGAPRKANVEPVRASLGSLSGGAVRLAEPEPGRPLLVGEGIESTAAAMVLFDLPGWAALGTSGLRNVELPRCIREVVIAADRDANGAGLSAAADLAERLESEGRRVEIRAPCTGDFADWL